MIQAGAWQGSNHGCNSGTALEVAGDWLGSARGPQPGKPSYGSKRNEGVGEHVRIEIQPEAPVNCGHEIRNVRSALTPFCRVGYRNQIRCLSDRLSLCLADTVCRLP